LKSPPPALLAVVALAGAAAGFVTFRHFVSAEPPRITAPAPLQAGSPPSAAQAPAEAPAPRIPEQVPDVQLPDLTGTPQNLRDISGRTRLYNFWATWCEPCQREIPLLNTLASTYVAQGLHIVGIAVDARDAVQKFLKTTPLHYTVLVGEEEGAEAAQDFGMELGLPFSVFADQQNRIVAIKVGELHRDDAEAILTHMSALERGTETLENARAAIAEALKALAVERAKQTPRKIG
jgi:thiol-disulfide isomerase/thioredoxin